jgi:NADH-quinone oxidoreductase subunit J
MSWGNAFFGLCSLVALMGALAVVTARNPIRGAVGLLTTVLGVAGLFLMLHAQFLAAIQLIVYAGAVVVLFVFVIMLLGPEPASLQPGRKGQIARGVGAAAMAAMAAAAMVALAGTIQPAEFAPARVDHGSVEAVGGRIFSAGLVPFELTTALLIAAIIGALAIAHVRPQRRGGPHDPGAKNAVARFFGGPVQRPEAQPQPPEEPLP